MRPTVNLNWQYMRLKLDTELREYVEFQCQDKIWDMRGIAADTVDGYGRIDNLINLFSGWVLIPIVVYSFI